MTQAIQELEHTLRIAPDHAGAQGLLGSLYLEQGQPAQAVTHFEKRLTMQPRHAETHLSLASAHLQLNQFDAAEVALEKCLELAPNLPELNHMFGIVYLEQKQLAWALKHFLREVEQNPYHIESLYNAGVCLSDLQRDKEAINYFERVLQKIPDHLPTLLNLAAVYLKQSRTDQAILHYQKALALDPNNAEIKHILHALTEDKIPDEAPAEYVSHLFDNYAGSYDKHLTGILEYSVPEKLHELVTTEVNPTPHSLNIADIGCGTGLCGARFRQDARSLIGVDLSADMLAIADQKNIYDQLINSAVDQALATLNDLDLIVAADVFTYIGNLTAVFTAAHQALSSSGYFAFSIEALTNSKDDYHLQKTIRYAHNKNYIETLCHRHGFSIISVENTLLRKNKTIPITGYLYLLKRNAGCRVD